jgi:hypothetical protein
MQKDKASFLWQTNTKILNYYLIKKGTTCCQLSTGDWGCCPLENAVCCEDHLHCCPQGYTCDVKDGRCNKGDVSLPFFRKSKSSPSKQNSRPNVDQVCPGGSSQCPSGSTCCQLSTGDFGCCPLPNASMFHNHKNFT